MHAFAKWVRWSWIVVQIKLEMWEAFATIIYNFWLEYSSPLLMTQLSEGNQASCAISGWGVRGASWLLGGGGVLWTQYKSFILIWHCFDARLLFPLHGQGIGSVLWPLWSAPPGSLYTEQHPVLELSGINCLSGLCVQKALDVMDEWRALHSGPDCVSPQSPHYQFKPGQAKTNSTKANESLSLSVVTRSWAVSK